MKTFPCPRRDLGKRVKESSAARGHGSKRQPVFDTLKSVLKNEFLLVASIMLLAETASSTSIVFPSFSAPIVWEGKAFFSEKYGSNLVCFDLTKKARKWRTSMDHEIRSSFIDTNRNSLLLGGLGRMSIVSCENAARLTQANVPGDVFGMGFGNAVFCNDWDKKEVHCYSYTEKRKLWTFAGNRKSNLAPVFQGDCVFVFVSPGKTMGNEILEGKNEIVCLSSSGATIWHEDVSLSRRGFGVRGSVTVNKSILLCSTDRFIQLLESGTGKKTRRYDSETDIDGASFWGDERIVLSLGGIGTSQRTARVLSIKDFTLISEFQFSAPEVSSIDAVEDVLLVHSLARNQALDLLQKKNLWEAFQRWQTVSNGQIFFGAGESEAGIPKRRIFGECDPRTGTTKTLYAEDLSPKK